MSQAPPTIRTVGLLVATHKKPALPCARELVATLADMGVEVRVRAELIGELPTAVAAEGDGLHGADLLMVVGGDGTILSAAREAAPLGTPILGVYVSGFGFLTETDNEALPQVLPDVIAGRFDIDERTMLEAETLDRPELGTVWALNDVVLRRERAPGMIDCSLTIAGTPIGGYRGDGVIVSTPTGSTCYSLAAFGPVVTPWLEAVVIAPLNTFTLNVRPLVVRADEEVRIQVRYKQSGPMGVAYSADGQPGVPVDDGDTLVCRQAPHSARFVRLEAGTFYTRLRQRLKWGAEI